MTKTSLFSFIFCFFFLAHSKAQTKTDNTVGAKTCIKKVRLGNIDSLYPTTEQILSKPEIVSLDPDCVVTGFKLFWVSHDRNTISKFESKNQYLTAEMKQFLGFSSSPLDRISIDYITLLCHNTEKCTSAPIILKGIKSPR